MGRSGKLDRRIRIERQKTARDDMGGDVDDGWVPLGTIWAGRMDLSDAEKFAADERAATRISRFRIRSSKMTRNITPVDRVVHEKLTYEITGIKETKEGRNNFIELTTVVRND